MQQNARYIRIAPGPFVQRMDNAVYRINRLKLDSVTFFANDNRWVSIYPVDCVIHPLKTWALLIIRNITKKGDFHQSVKSSSCRFVFAILRLAIGLNISRDFLDQSGVPLKPTVNDWLAPV